MVKGKGSAKFLQSLSLCLFLFFQFQKILLHLHAIGVAGELGGILRFGKFCISAGFHTVNFKYHEVTGGLGFVF